MKKVSLENLNNAFLFYQRKDKYGWISRQQGGLKNLILEFKIVMALNSFHISGCPATVTTLSVIYKNLSWNILKIFIIKCDCSSKIITVKYKEK